MTTDIPDLQELKIRMSRKVLDSILHTGHPTNQKNFYPLDRLEVDLVELWLLVLLVLDLLFTDDDFLLL